MLVLTDPERRSPRYYETFLALESVEESSAAVGEPRSVGLRVLVVHDLKEACRLPVRVQKQQARNGCGLKCWRWPVRSPVDGGDYDTAPCTLQSCVAPSHQGPCPGCLGEERLRSIASAASSSAQHPRGSAGS